MNNINKYPTILLATITTIPIVIAANYFFRQPLYALGVQQIKSLQHSQSQPLTFIFLLITTLIDPSIVLLVTIIVIVFSRRKGRAYCLLLFILLNTYLTGILKAIHCDPRPFWSDNLVRSIGFYCPQEYGNPSGHSWFITVLCFAFLIDFYGVGKKYLHLVVSLALLVLVPMSRMYLGAHSLNQVLEGLTLGLAINIIYVLMLKKHICNFYQRFPSYPGYNWLILCMHVLYLGVFLVNVGDELPDQWINNVHRKCGKEVDEGKLNFLMLMVNSGMVWLMMGVGMGMKQMLKHKFASNYLEGKWAINQQQYTWKMGYAFYTIINIVFLVLPILPFVVICFILPYYPIIFICMNCGAMLATYLHTGYILPFLLRYKLIK